VVRAFRGEKVVARPVRLASQVLSRFGKSQHQRVLGKLGFLFLEGVGKLKLGCFRGREHSPVLFLGGGQLRKQDDGKDENFWAILHGGMFARFLHPRKEFEPQTNALSAPWN
jgi:hypothetical protein